MIALVIELIVCKLYSIASSADVIVLLLYLFVLLLTLIVSPTTIIVYQAIQLTG